MRSSVIIGIVSLVIVCCLAAPGGAQKEMAGQGVPFAMEKQVQDIPVIFVTLRNKTENSDPSEYFGGSRGKLITGICNVKFTPIWGVGDLAESVPFYIPDEKIELTDIREKTLTHLHREIESFSQKDTGNLVLYIHGYNIDFEKSCQRSALFQRGLGLQDRLLLFSWPADGNMLKYTWDEADLVWSVPHIARFLEQVFSFTGSGNVDVVAHSLGARGVVQALVRLSYRKNVGQIINELILIAPDIDTDVFQQELPQLSSVVGRITVYVSENDKALRLSQEVHGYQRLGQAGENLTVFEGVESIDISNIVTRRLSGHLYHLFNPEVIDDLTELLHTGKPADQRSRLKELDYNGLPYWQLRSEDP